MTTFFPADKILAAIAVAEQHRVRFHVRYRDCSGGELSADEQSMALILLHL